MPNAKTKTYVLLVLSMALWGGTWVAGRLLAQSMSPMTAAFLRFVFASGFLLLMSRRVTGRFVLPEKRQIPAVLFLGATGVFLYSFFFFNGLETIAAGRAALIVACIPVCISAVSAIFYKEPFGTIRVVGTLLSLAGVAVVISDGNPIALLKGGVSTGDLYILGCVASWTAYSLGGKAVMRTLSPLYSVTWSCVFGALLLFPAALASGLTQEAVSATPLDWLCIVYLGVLATGLAYFWYYSAIQSLGASRAGIFINLVPVFAVVLGFLLLSEPIHLSLLAGGAMVVGGVWMTNRP